MQKLNPDDFDFRNIDALSHREAADLLGVDRDFVWSIPFDGNKGFDSPRLNVKIEAIERELDSNRTARSRTAGEFGSVHGLRILSDCKPTSGMED